MKIVKTAKLGEAVLAFSLEGEDNANLRNKIRRRLENFGLTYTGTSLYAGRLPQEELDELTSQIVSVVEADESGAVLTNLEVWLYSNVRYSLAEQSI